jgi:hypothetical protein
VFLVMCNVNAYGIRVDASIGPFVWCVHCDHVIVLLCCPSSSRVPSLDCITTHCKEMTAVLLGCRTTFLLFLLLLLLLLLPPSKELSKMDNKRASC